MEPQSSLLRLMYGVPSALNNLQGFLTPSDTVRLLSTSKALATGFRPQLVQSRAKTVGERFALHFKTFKGPKDALFKLDLAKHGPAIVRALGDAVLVSPADQSKATLPPKFRDPNLYRILYSARTGKHLVVSRCWADAGLDLEQKKDADNAINYRKMIEEINQKSILEEDDSRSRFMRHKRLQEEIRHSDALSLPKAVDLAAIAEGWAKFALLMFHGGDFSFAVFENFKETVHASDHKYVIRKKGGGKQSTKDGQKSIKSIGSQIRRANEKQLNQNVDDLIAENAGELNACRLILVYSPGSNILKVVSALEAAGVPASKVRSIGFSSQKAKYSEVLNVFNKITKVVVE